MASPRLRLESNVDGDFFVDSSCIDCGTCRWMAPQTFDAHGGYARVHTQPSSSDTTEASLRALVSCPTASIGTVGKHDVRAIAAQFPYEIADGIYHCGFHSEDSYGAASYLIVRPEGNVLVDSPRFTPGLAKNIEALGGVHTMFLTHRDDVVDHEKFAQRFSCRRVLHRDDVSHSTRDVELQIEGSQPVDIETDLRVVPVPGHTRGSACLIYRDRFMFSGDHVAWSIPLGQVYAFRSACWYSWSEQITSMKRLAEHRFEHILPGHGAPCSFSASQMRTHMLECIGWMEKRVA